MLVSNSIENSSNVKILLSDFRILSGTIVFCDNYMNTVLKHCKEIRRNDASSKWEVRKIGLCILRGNYIISISVA